MNTVSRIQMVLTGVLAVAVTLLAVRVVDLSSRSGSPATTGVCVSTVDVATSQGDAYVSNVSRPHLEGGILSCQDGQFQSVVPSGPDTAP